MLAVLLRWGFIRLFFAVAAIILPTLKAQAQLATINPITSMEAGTAVSGPREARPPKEAEVCFARRPRLLRRGAVF
jgi:hypothetical protein